MTLVCRRIVCYKEKPPQLFMPLAMLCAAVNTLRGGVHGNLQSRAVERCL